MPAHDDYRLASGPLHRFGGDAADGLTCRGSPACHRGAGTLGCFFGLARLGRCPIAQFSGLRGYLVLGRAGLAAQVVLDLRSPMLRPRLHIGLRGQGLHSLAEVLPSALDLLGQGLFLWRTGARSVLAHRCALSLIFSTSALTLSAALLGIGGVAFLNWLFPASAAMPAAANSAMPMISAASH